MKTNFDLQQKIICQCCGMPLDTSSKSSENDSYCKWCFKDGKVFYTNINELTDFLVNHLSNENWPPEQARAFFEDQLPKLDYWKNSK